MDTIPYGGWQNCVRLSNDMIELIITADVGPRIMRAGFSGERNLFKEFDEQMGQTGGTEWRAFGGHRLWHAPEAIPRSYQPDNTPITIIDEGLTVRALQPTETATGIQKEMVITLSPDSAEATVVHRLGNHNLWPVELAPWALSVMAPGGVGILPLPPRGSHDEFLLPSSSIALWPYTDLSDPRYTFCETAILVQQDPRNTVEQKIGVYAPDGWAGYALDGFLFVTRFEVEAGAAYPDLNCTHEFFINDAILEVETLGPLARVEPGAWVEHTEHWRFFRDVAAPRGEDDLVREVYPKVGG